MTGSRDTGTRQSYIHFTDWDDWMFSVSISLKDCICQSSYGKAPCTVVSTLWRSAIGPPQHWYYKTITLNRKQMAIKELAKGEKQL